MQILQKFVKINLHRICADVVMNLPGSFSLCSWIIVQGWRSNRYRVII